MRLKNVFLGGWHEINLSLDIWVCGCHGAELDLVNFPTFLKVLVFENIYWAVLDRQECA